MPKCSECFFFNILDDKAVCNKFGKVEQLAHGTPKDIHESLKEAQKKMTNSCADNHKSCPSCVE